MGFMSSISEHIERIRAVNETAGTAELARQAGLPYTTVVDWKARNFRPRSVDIFEQLAEAADALSTTSHTAAPENTRIDGGFSGGAV